MGARGSAAKCPRPTRSEECSSCFGIVGARRRRGRLHPTRPVVYQRRRAVGRWAVRDVPRADESRSPAALDKPDVRVGAPVPLQVRLPTTKNRSTLSVSYAVDCASLLLLGPDPTMLVAGAGAWSQSTLNRLNLEIDLRLGLSRKEFQLHYRPIVSLKTDQLVGFGGLAPMEASRRGNLAAGRLHSAGRGNGAPQ